jgi:hypothetical protein
VTFNIDDYNFVCFVGKRTRRVRLCARAEVGSYAIAIYLLKTFHFRAYWIHFCSEYSIIAALLVILGVFIAVKK